MKRLVFLFALAGMLFAQPLSAQIKMSSDGKVKIGSNVSTTSSYDLEVGMPSMLFKGEATFKGTLTTFSVAGMDLCISNTTPVATPRAGGLVIGGDFPSREEVPDRIRIAGPNHMVEIGSAENELFRIYAKKYYSTTVSSVELISDRRFKTNIEDLSPTLNKMMQLRPVRFDYLDGKDGERSTDSARLNRVGLIAQELNEVFPEAVHYMPNEDIYTIEYAALIPFLIKTVQEQQARIDEQDAKIEELQMLVLDSDVITASAHRQNSRETSTTVGASTQDAPIATAPVATISENKLWSNTPNPFKQETHIRYALTNNVQNAQLCIYNLNGEQIACHRLSDRGQNNFTLRAGSLRPGIYLYSLIADGNVVDTHRMVVTE